MPSTRRATHALTAALLIGLLPATGILSARAESPSASSSVLQGMTLAKGPIAIAAIEEDLSGIAYNPESHTFFVVTDVPPPYLWELNADFELIRKIAMPGYDDVEDVTVMGPGRVAVIEERRRLLHTAELPAGASTLDTAQATSVSIPAPGEENAGIEGLTYDAVGQRFFIVKEKGPRAIYQVTAANTPDQPASITQPWDAQERSLDLDDLSGVYWHAASGHLLVLSDESHAVVECTPDGTEIARLPLGIGQSGLIVGIGQPEGITMDDQGRLVISGEPNRVYIFAKP